MSAIALEGLQSSATLFFFLLSVGPDLVISEIKKIGEKVRNVKQIAQFSGIELVSKNGR